MSFMLFFPFLFMFAVTVGALQDFAENIPGLDYRAFQLPVAVMFAVTGISRAITVVTDIQTGYFARLVITPVNRLALLLGLLVADSALIVALTAPVVIMGYIVGVRFETGIPGILSFMLFFPFLFMTTLFIPQEQMSPWLSRVADYNPVTYILAAERSLISEGWQLAEIRDGILATLAVGVLSIGLALAALKGRATRK